jgi:hypothetical protein
MSEALYESDAREQRGAKTEQTWARKSHSVVVRTLD